MYQSFLDAIPANVAIIDQGGVIIAVNAAWRQFGTENACIPEAIGLGVNYLLVCRSAGALDHSVTNDVADGLEALLAGHSQSFEFEYPCHSLNEKRWFTCRCAPIQLMDGGRGAMIMHIDITTRRLAEEKVREQSDARYNFICELAHEIRSPLNAIIGFSELLKLRSVPEQSESNRHNHVELILKSAWHANDVVENVLALAKAESGSYSLVEQPVSLDELLRDIVGVSSSLARIAGVALNHASMPGGDDCLVLADKMLLRQALMNVVVNAIKYSPRGGTVKLFSTLHADGAINIVVEDHGPGIPPEDIERVMRPFEQSDPTRNTERLGVGLGLPLSRRFMRLHGGELRLISAMGSGTAAVLSLPRKRLQQSKCGATTNISNHAGRGFVDGQSSARG